MTAPAQRSPPVETALPPQHAMKFCCLCGAHIDAFRPWIRRKENPFTEQFQCIGSDTTNFTCPKCGNHDRSRHLHLYMETLGIYDLLRKREILYVAPELPLYNILKSLTDHLIVGDIHPEKYPAVFAPMVQIDLCELPYEPAFFDALIANHVLEHIVDYRGAMKEIFRVLKPGGIAILQTPFSPLIYNHFEDPLLNTDELRDAFFGQADHVRIFGRRFFDDLIAVGFQTYLMPHSEFLKAYDPSLFGVNEREPFMLSIKPMDDQATDLTGDSATTGF